ncbi:MAG: DUF808 family protein [Sulfurovaceae bacterium]|nr:DUF808 family protein [Sulfurovaceae bacterium]
MAGILGYLAALTDDISSLAGQTMASSSKAVASSLDNTSVMLDDIATYTKIASAKSSGVVVDDLAAIANLTNETTTSILQQEIKKAHSIEELKSNIKSLEPKTKQVVSEELEKLRESIGAEAKRKAAARELPIVWKIAKGSMLNKVIIIPLILIISAIAPWLMKPILIFGGLYLSYEGVDSVLEKFFDHHEAHGQKETIEELSTEHFETRKVKSAIKTDFILSLEIMVLALSLLSHIEIITKLIILVAVGFITTLAVYGIVAFIIKLDDIGFFLQARTSGLANKIGDSLVYTVPHLIKSISIIGTVAMLAVGGGIIAHQTGLFYTIEEMLHHYFISLYWLAIFILETVFGAIIGYITVKFIKIAVIFKQKIKNFF